MIRFGLTGFPLGHSFSPAYFNQKFKALGLDAEYSLYPLEEISTVKSLFENDASLRGLNVTIPHKQSVIPFLNDITAEAASIGAVNCIKLIGDRLIGHNTDVVGFEQSLKNHLTSTPKSAIIAGTGGSSKAVIYVLSKLGIPTLVIGRNTSPNYAQIELEQIQQADLIVNCTPLGMSPNTTSRIPLPIEGFRPGQLIFDLVYNPEQTELMTVAQSMGANAINGYEMLIGQAEAAFDFWNDGI